MHFENEPTQEIFRHAGEEFGPIEAPNEKGIVSAAPLLNMEREGRESSYHTHPLERVHRANVQIIAAVLPIYD